MKPILLSVLVAVCLGIVGCARGSCVEKISHGPWEAIGPQPPKKAAVEEQFKEGGLPALLLALGKPLNRSEQQVVWVFEARSVSPRQRCSPERKENIYDQSFTIVSVRLGSDMHECRYEVRELLSKEIYVVKDFALIPETPLGIKQISCGVRTKSERTVERR